MYFFRLLNLRRLSLLSLCLFLISCAPAAAGAPKPMGPADFIIKTVMFFLLGLFIYYVLILKPQQDAQLQQKKVAELKKNDKVVTSSGIFGRLQSVVDDVVTIEIAPNVKIRVQASHVLPDTSDQQESAKKDSTK